MIADIDSVALIFVAILGACRGDDSASAPKLTVDIPEVSIDEEHLRAAIPPDWRVGQTWSVETETAMLVGLEQSPYPAGWWEGEADFRVDELDAEEAVVSVSLRTRSSRPPIDMSWRLLYAMDPFLLRGEYVSDRRGQDDNYYDEDGSWFRVIFDGTPVLRGGPSSPEAPFFHDWGIKMKQTWSVDDRGVWFQFPDIQASQNVKAVRRVLWRPGDPWFALAEGFDEQGHLLRGRDRPARARLVAIDGERIEPLPWTE